MKWRIVAALLAVVCLLAGCGNDPLYPEGKNITCKDLALTIPGDFVDLSTEDSAKDTDFQYGNRALVFKGMAESKTELKAMTLAEYTAYVISGNELPCTPELFGDGYLFSYEAPVGDTVYAYTIATFESDANFWIFQFFCPAAQLQESQPEIDIILESIRKKP